MSCSPEWIDTISSGQATFISAKQATLHYINTALTEIYSFVSFEGKKALSMQLNIKVSTEVLGMSK